MTPEHEPMPLYDVVCENHGLLDQLHHPTNAVPMIYFHILENPECKDKVFIYPADRDKGDYSIDA